MVAIKIVESVGGNMEQDDENARESLVAASVSHPNVVRPNAPLGVTEAERLICMIIGRPTHISF